MLLEWEEGGKGATYDASAGFSGDHCEGEVPWSQAADDTDGLFRGDDALVAVRGWNVLSMSPDEQQFSRVQRT